MGKHKDKKKSTTNSKLLFMGMGIIVGVLITMLIVFVIMPMMQMAPTKDALLPESSDPISQTMPSQTMPSQTMPSQTMPSTPMPSTTMPGAPMSGGRRLFKNRFR